MATEQEKAKFGRRLRELREARSLSAQALAAMISTKDESWTHASVTGWERGEYAPRLRRTIDNLEAALGAEGELLPLLGYSASPDGVHERLDAVEAGLEQVRGDIAKLTRLVRRRPRDPQ